MRLLVLHGWGGSDYPHWQAHLAMEAIKRYGSVSFPLICHPHYPNKNRWLKQLHHFMESFSPDTVVCHSLSNTLWFWYRQLEGALATKRLFLVSPPSLATNLETLSTFFPATLPQNIGADEVTLIVSDNDPYITLEEAMGFVDRIASKHIVVPNGGHINAQSGFGKWELIEKLVIKNDKMCK